MGFFIVPFDAVVVNVALPTIRADFDATFTLDDIAEAYAAMDERRAIKALVKVSELA